MPAAYAHIVFDNGASRYPEARQLVGGHAGGNKSLMNGWSERMFSWGQVTTAGISTKGLNETVIGRVRKSK